MRFVVTGGAGFIGSAVVRHLIQDTPYEVLNIDKLTYAGNLANVADVAGSPRYRFLQADIGDSQAMAAAMADFRPSVVMHLAAESHVDRSIDGPRAFIETNIVGSYALLEVCRRYWSGLSASGQAAFRFHQVSTDEVFGALGETGCFTESTAYDPRSPYSASKAASDHLASAWHHTFGLPVIITNCSNNYGPYHLPEKLIPLTIVKAVLGEQLPVYGAGANVRDWLYVEDHARGLVAAATQGIPGQRYNFGGNAERRNLDVVTTICSLLDELRPDAVHGPYARLITYVADRPGHDYRYAVDTAKAGRDLGWRPSITFEEGLRRTVQWYLDHESWWQAARSRGNGGERLGVAA